MTRNRQIEHWTGDFGDAYVERSPATEEQIRIRVSVLTEMFNTLVGDPPASVLECGCNIGLNTRAFARFHPAEQFAVEPNVRARQTVLDDGVLDADHLKDGTVQNLPFADGSMDLVFTSGVLIHVHPDDLPAAFDEMVRVSSRYLLLIEYFSRDFQEVAYRDREELLWKGDFGGALLDRHPSLIPLRCGFFWHRTTGFDDSTWWMFRKP